MTVTYTEAIFAANLDLIERIMKMDNGGVNNHGISERFKYYGDAADIREVTGRTRLFTIEYDGLMDTVTHFSNQESTQTLARVIIGYDKGPDFDLAANADILAIRHMVNNPDGTIPAGLEFYLQTGPHTWENINGFRWMSLPIIIQITSTTE
jgi:hypothetical protein